MNEIKHKHFVKPDEYNTILDNLNKLNQSLQIYKETLSKYGFEYSFKLDELLTNFGETNFKKALKSDVKVAIDYDKSLNKESFKNEFINSRGFNRHEIVEQAFNNFISNYRLLINDEQPQINTLYNIEYNIYNISNTDFTRFLENISKIIEENNKYFNIFTGMVLMNEDLPRAFSTIWDWYYNRETNQLTENGLSGVNSKIGNDERFYNVERIENITFEL